MKMIKMLVRDHKGNNVQCTEAVVFVEIMPSVGSKRTKLVRFTALLWNASSIWHDMNNKRKMSNGKCWYRALSQEENHFFQTINFFLIPGRRKTITFSDSLAITSSFAWREWWWRWRFFYIITTLSVLVLTTHVIESVLSVAHDVWVYVNCVDARSLCLFAFSRSLSFNFTLFLSLCYPISSTFQDKPLSVSELSFSWVDWEPNVEDRPQSGGGGVAGAGGGCGVDRAVADIIARSTPDVWDNQKDVMYASIKKKHTQNIRE